MFRFPMFIHERLVSLGCCYAVFQTPLLQAKIQKGSAPVEKGKNDDNYHRWLMVSLSITSQLPVPSVSNLLTMVKFGKQPIIEDPIQIADPTAWMIENLVADFLLMPGAVVYMCMFGYTFLHGCKVFKALPSESSIAYKFVSLLFACTGGGIIVPIFLNGVPVPLANDAYPIAVMASFALHHYFPILREVVAMSKIVKVSA